MEEKVIKTEGETTKDFKENEVVLKNKNGL